MTSQRRMSLMNGLGACAATLAALGFAPAAVQAAEGAPAAAASADEAAAKAIAAEMTAKAGQFGATRVAAGYFADPFDGHHHPPMPGDGMTSGPKVAAGVATALSRYQARLPDYRVDEKVTVKGDVITLSTYATGTFADGGKFEDVSVQAYKVSGGKIVRTDSVHTNFGAIQKAMAGSTARAEADHAAAERIAAQMRATGGGGVDLVPKYLRERVALLPPGRPERNAVYSGAMIGQQLAKEMSMVKAAMVGYASAETIKVEGNRIIIDGKMTGKMRTGEDTWSDSLMVLHISDDSIVAISTSHSPGAMDNLRRLMAAAGG